MKLWEFLVVVFFGMFACAALGLQVRYLKEKMDFERPLRVVWNMKEVAPAQAIRNKGGWLALPSDEDIWGSRKSAAFLYPIDGQTNRPGIIEAAMSGEAGQAFREYYGLSKLDSYTLKFDHWQVGKRKAEVVYFTYSSDLGLPPGALEHPSQKKQVRQTQAAEHPSAASYF